MVYFFENDNVNEIYFWLDDSRFVVWKKVWKSGKGAGICYRLGMWKSKNGVVAFVLSMLGPIRHGVWRFSVVWRGNCWR